MYLYRCFLDYMCTIRPSVSGGYFISFFTTRTFLADLLWLVSPVRRWMESRQHSALPLAPDLRGKHLVLLSGKVWAFARCSPTDLVVTSWCHAVNPPVSTRLQLPYPAMTGVILVTQNKLNVKYPHLFYRINSENYLVLVGSLASKAIPCCLSVVLVPFSCRCQRF